jgi:hypothetical protein
MCPTTPPLTFPWSNRCPSVDIPQYNQHHGSDPERVVAHERLHQLGHLAEVGHQRSIGHVEEAPVHLGEGGEEVEQEGGENIGSRVYHDIFITHLGKDFADRFQDIFVVPVTPPKDTSDLQGQLGQLGHTHMSGEQSEAQFPKAVDSIPELRGVGEKAAAAGLDGL